MKIIADIASILKEYVFIARFL